MRKGSWEEQKEKLDRSSDFHLDTKVDSVETLIEQIGWDDARAQIEANLDQNPDDQEARRQATLIVKLHDDKIKPLRDKLQH